MKKFEYKTVDVSLIELSKGLVYFLNKYGAEGWELVDVGRNKDTGEILAVLFKREM